MSIKRIQAKINSPFQLEIPMMEFQNLNMMVGQNATGKSFLLKLAWLSQMVPYIASKQENVMNSSLQQLKSTGQVPEDFVMTEEEEKEMFHDMVHKQMDYFIRNTFTESENVDFEFTAETESINEDGKVLIGRCTMIFNQNELETLYLTGEGRLSSVPVYMSNEMRTFSAMDRYVVSRIQLFGTEKRFTAETGLDYLKDLLELYRIYDLLAVERLIANSPFSIPSQIKESLKPFDLQDIEYIDVDMQRKCFVYKKTDSDEIRPISTLSSGQQAVLNIVLQNI